MRFVLAALAVFFAVPAHAIVWTGQLPEGDDTVYLNLSIDRYSNLEAFTTSYATGGFDPILSLYRANGRLLTFNDDDGFRPSQGIFDSTIFGENLRPGQYLMGISQYALFPEDNFVSTGFLPTECPDNTGFCDVFGNNTTSDYRVEYNISPVPVPPALGLMAAGLVGLTAVARRRRPKAVADA